MAGVEEPVAGRANSPASPPIPTAQQMAPRREIFAWAMFDFANSGYTTVVLTAIFNAYFVGVVVGGGSGLDRGAGTLLWTIATSVGYVLVLLSAPIIGAIADYRADKKRFLIASAIGCVVATAALSLAGPGDVLLAMVLVVISNLMFSAGENLIAAFLPELVPQQAMGRISGYGWTLGYVGGLLVLAVCLWYVDGAQARGLPAEVYVPVTLWITAGAFTLAALPTVLWMRERAQRRALPDGKGYIAIGFSRLHHTWLHARRYRDLFRFLAALTVFYCGIYTVIVLAAVYAQEVMGFTTRDNILLILIVNISAAAGAFAFGYVQDGLGSIRTLAITLLIWIAALLIAYFTHERAMFWLAANLIGVALGSSQSAGRALVGQFSPRLRTAEFFGLWGLATKLAAVIGPLSYGLVTYLSAGDHRVAIVSTITFFVAGLLLLAAVDEQRGRREAQRVYPDD